MYETKPDVPYPVISKTQPRQKRQGLLKVSTFNRFVCEPVSGIAIIMTIGAARVKQGNCQNGSTAHRQNIYGT